MQNQQFENVLHLDFADGQPKVTARYFFVNGAVSGTPIWSGDYREIRRLQGAMENPCFFERANEFIAKNHHTAHVYVEPDNGGYK